MYSKKTEEMNRKKLSTNMTKYKLRRLTMGLASIGISTGIFLSANSPSVLANENGQETDQITNSLMKKIDEQTETKTVTRTINYLYHKDGTKASEQIVQQILFERTVQTNLETREKMYGEWQVKNGYKNIFQEVYSPVVEGYILENKAPDGSEKNYNIVEEKANITADTPDETINIYYVSLGKWVIKSPDGKEAQEPITYFNDWRNPSNISQDLSHLDRVTINTIEGYEVMGPEGPLDWKNYSPSVSGYIFPTPKDPTKDTLITYSLLEKLVVKCHLVDKDGNFIRELGKDFLYGKSGEKTEILNSISKILGLRADSLNEYKLLDGEYKKNIVIFDNDPNTTQEVILNFIPYKKLVVNYQLLNEDGSFDKELGQRIFTGEPGNKIDSYGIFGNISYKIKPNYKIVNNEFHNDFIMFDNDRYTTQEVTIKFIPDPNYPSHPEQTGGSSGVQRKINYRYRENGKLALNSVIQNISFVTGETQWLGSGTHYGEWRLLKNYANTFPELVSPTIKGYVLENSDFSVIPASKEITPYTPDEEIDVYYVRSNQKDNTSNQEEKKINSENHNNPDFNPTTNNTSTLPSNNNQPHDDAYVALAEKLIKQGDIQGAKKAISNVINETKKTRLTAMLGLNGWTKVDGKWYYYNKGEMVKGWFLEEKSGNWFYLDPKTGVMHTGLTDIDGVLYYFGTLGNMYKGWVNVNGTWYYFHKNLGNAQTGWKSINNKWYYLGKDGKMVKGFYTDRASSTFYLNEKTGEMHTGWFNVKGKWYYARENGSLVKGWILDKNK